MQKAVYLSDLNCLNSIAKIDFQRLYFGNEFCEHLIPKIAQLEKALIFAKDNSLDFSFVTPSCTDAKIKQLLAIFEILPDGCEVIFNDWGVFSILKKFSRGGKFKLVLGRLLVGQIKDPRLAALKNNNKLEFFRKSCLSNPAFQDFLIDQGIGRAEIDNSFQGHGFKLKNSLNVSLYYPYAYISTTTRCIFKKNPYLYRCDIECMRYRMLVSKIKNFSGYILTRGNTEFYFNDQMPKYLNDADMHINREVFLPALGY